MTELQQYQPRTELATTSQDVAVQRLAEWAQSADAAFHVAQRLVESSFVPAAFRNKPIEATAAILAGTEVGLSPMSALRAFDVIQGQAAPRAITLRAVVQSYGHEVVLVESTNTRCRMKGKRKGSDQWQTVTWTIERAKELGLTGKDNWKKQPGAMLVARATSELARLIASDAILGIGYSSEEVADGGPTEARVTEDTTAPAPAATTRKMSRKPKPAAEDGTPVRDEEGQRRAMFAAFRDAGFPNERSDDGRQARLDYIGQTIGREIETSNDLTWDEISAVIDSLKDPVPAEESTTGEADTPDPTDGSDPWAGGQS
jgi:hypothetical protein